MRIQVLKYVSEVELNEMQLDFSIPDNEIWVEIDQELVDRVIYNLIQNAVKYNKTGTRIFVGVKEKNDEVEIEIADNGIGMKTDLQDTIFEPFVRDDWARNSKTGGSGLGLAVCKKIMKIHEGSISLKTNENKGCRFYLTFKKIDQF
jgi:signal transduction histidine kinase